MAKKPGAEPNEPNDELSDWQKREMESFERNVIGKAEAAELLGVTEDHVDELCRRGKIMCKRTGPHSWAIYRPSIKKYLRTKSAKGKPPSRAPKVE